MSDKVVSVGPESFKIQPDGTVIVDHGVLKDLILKSQAQNVSLEVMDAFLEISPILA
ncbi:hypothetical protein ACE102_25405 [Bradyrhizobium sp. vgs-9]|uniref:hypothetical protein n=1 Tax=Bradyrhizobium sp. vgs-9 TaxID=208389 RepID=UPI0035D4664A